MPEPRFPNRFGHFTPAGDAFVLTRHDAPMPWCNVICNGRYGLVVSQNGGGFSFLDNSQLNVLTRWEMDLARDAHGRFLYLADLDTPDHARDLWSLAPAPTRVHLDDYRCTHALGSTTFQGAHAGIRHAWTLTVPPGETAEVWAVTLTNESDRTRRLRLAAYLEWCCGVAPDVKREFHRLFLNTTDHTDRPGVRAIAATKNMWDIPDRTEKDHWNRPWPYAAALAVDTRPFQRTLATSDKERALGRYHDPARPAGLLRDPGPQPHFGRFGDAVAMLGGDLVLEPGASVTLRFVLAIDAAVPAALDIAQRLARPEAPAEPEARAFWRGLLDPVRAETGLDDFDLLNNHWLPYQAISARLWGRTGYYQQSGAFGFRDQLQDSNVWLPRAPERTAEQIMLHAAHQFADGHVYHWWHPLAEFGLQTACSDDYLWLPYLVARYIRETGDAAILDRSAPFVDDADGATIREHCRRSIARMESRLSDRGLPLIGSCDWNDGLSAVGIEGRGESVWLAFFAADILRDWAVLMDRAGDAPAADAARARRAALIDAANAHAWDGAWYRRATTDAGDWIGTHTNAHGRIYLNAQTWAILADAAPPDRAARAWSSTMEHLVQDMGPLLLHPAYDTPDEDVGYITRYPPGLRENGGVYMHAATWALATACKRRDRAAATRIWNAISPPRRGTDADAYVAEPYVTPGNVDGPTSERPGRAGWTWYTGSAAWLHTVSLEWVLGVRPEWDGLRIDPCPVEGMRAVRLARRWRGREIVIEFDARDYREGAAPILEVMGRALDGPVLRERDCAPAGPTTVRVSWATSPVPEVRTRPVPAGERTAP